MPLDDEARRRAAATKKKRTYLSIVTAVRDMLDESDYVERVTHSSVAERAGVSEATVYRYFPSVGELRRAPFNTVVLISAEDMPEVVKSIIRPVTMVWSPENLAEMQGVVKRMLDEGDYTEAEMARLFLDAFMRLKV